MAGALIGGTGGFTIAIGAALVIGLSSPVRYSAARDHLALISDGRRPATEAGPARARLISSAIGVVLAVVFFVVIVIQLIAYIGDGIGSWVDFMTEGDREAEIRTLFIEHAQLVLAAMFGATIAGVGSGIIAYRFEYLRGAFLGIAAFFLTIPSFALFALFIPIDLVGIGDRGPIIAMTMYAQLPILRNTITGLAGVDRAVVESAKGMGMSSFQRLRKIEFPLAWPVILTGVRVATLLTVGIAAIAVLVGGGGLGRFVQDGLTRHGLPTSIERDWTGVVFILILAQLFDLGFGILRRTTTPKGLRT
ncbi:MAG: ABC transporter permease [Acidimicrobiia bacterium]